MIWAALTGLIPMLAEMATYHNLEEQRKNSEAIDVEAYYIDDRLTLPAPKKPKCS